MGSMKNLILQYWTGPLPEWARLAMKSIELYAKDMVLIINS